MSDTVVYRSGRKKWLPKFCECGGKMLYAFDFGRMWSCCDTCSPVVNWPSKLGNPAARDTQREPQP